MHISFMLIKKECTRPQHQKRKKMKKKELNRGRSGYNQQEGRKRKFFKNLLRRQKFGQSNKICASKKKKIKRRNADLKCAVNAFNKLVDSIPTKKFVEYFKQEIEKPREHEKASMQMQCNMQLQIMQILSESHMAVIYLVQCQRIGTSDMDIL